MILFNNQIVFLIAAFFKGLWCSKRSLGEKYIYQFPVKFTVPVHWCHFGQGKFCVTLQHTPTPQQIFVTSLFNNHIWGIITKNMLTWQLQSLISISSTNATKHFQVRDTSVNLICYKYIFINKILRLRVCLAPTKRQTSWKMKPMRKYRNTAVPVMAIWGWL